MGAEKPGDVSYYDPPAAPTFKQSVGQISAGMPDYVAMEREFSPQLNQLSFDQLARFALQYNALSNQMANQQRGDDLRTLLNYGSAYKAAQESVNPKETAIRGVLGDQIFEELKSDGVDPYLDRELSQGVRAGQAARGMTMGNSPVSSEALARGSFANDLRNQRQSKASGFLSMPAFDAFQATLGRPSQSQSNSAMGAFQNRGADMGGMAMNNLGMMNNQWNMKNQIGQANNQMANNRMYMDYQHNQQNNGWNTFKDIWTMGSPFMLAGL